MRNPWVVLISLSLSGSVLGSKQAQASSPPSTRPEVLTRDGGTSGSDVPDGGDPQRAKEEAAQIRSHITAHRAEIRECYDRALTRAPQLQGKVVVRFTIIADGSIIEPSAVENTVGDLELEQCITTQMTTWRFPPDRKGGKIVVTYPFLFKPAKQPDAGVPDAGVPDAGTQG